MAKATAQTSEAIAAAADKKRFTGASGVLMDSLRALPEEADGTRRIPGDLLGNIARSTGKSGGWASVMLGGWEKQGVLKRLKQGRRIVGVRLAAHQPVATEPATEQPEQGTESMKDRVLALLQRRADSKGQVRDTTDALRKELGLDVHDFTKYAWDLKKQGLLQFREKKIGSQKELHSMQLRGPAVPKTVSRQERATLGDTVLASEPWEICPECYWARRWHRVAPDNANLLICPSRPKEGSPRWQRQTGRGHAQAAADAPAAKRGDVADHVIKNNRVLGSVHPTKPAGADTSYTKPGPVTSTYRCSECQPPQDFNDPAALRMHREAKHAIGKPRAVDGQPVAPEVQPEQPVQPEAQPTPPPASEEGTMDIPVRYTMDDPVAHALLQNAVVRAVDRADYPAISAMLAQQAARTRAVQALEAAGEDDMALALLAKLEEGLDPVVAEALRLARQLGWDKEDAGDGNR